MTEGNFHLAFGCVNELVSDFQKNEKIYFAPDCKEEGVRKNFIDKFWMALGWDVTNERRNNPYRREVKIEEKVMPGGRIKKADYAFLAANFRDVRYFVEAKKTALDIDNADDYFRTIRYEWNAQITVSILTDFAQLSLLLELLEDEMTASTKGRQLEVRETRLPSHDKNIRQGIR